MPDIAARQVCTTALTLIGVAAAEQPIEAVMAEAALDALNSMLSGWATERLLTYTRPRLALPLVSGQGTYTWGATPAAIVAPPPVRLELCLFSSASAPSQEWPVRIVGQTEYEAGVLDKTLQASEPSYVYLEMAQPHAILHVYPVPNAGGALFLFPWQAREPYTALDHVLAWPEGSERAMSFNLAVDLGPQYPPWEPSPTVLRIAEESKRLLGNVNVKVGRLTSDYGGSLRQSDIPTVDIDAFLRGWR